MHWVLQDDLFSETGWDTLVETIQRSGLPHSVHKVVPFVGELLPAPALAHQNVICFGSYSMRHAARRYGWRPGVFDLYEHAFAQQLARWGEHLLNAASRLCRFEAVRFEAEAMFVRPVNDSKCFAAQLIGERHWAHSTGQAPGQGTAGASATTRGRYSSASFEISAASSRPSASSRALRCLRLTSTKNTRASRQAAVRRSK